MGLDGCVIVSPKLSPQPLIANAAIATTIATTTGTVPFTHITIMNNTKIILLLYVDGPRRLRDCFTKAVTITSITTANAVTTTKPEPEPLTPTLNNKP